MVATKLEMTEQSIIAELSTATGVLLKQPTGTAASLPAATALSPASPAPGFRRLKLAAAIALAVPSALIPPVAIAADPGEWDVDTAIFFYRETDRVTAIEPVISATRQFDNDRTLNLKLVLDSLTGASPSGAVPSSQVQTFTRPSGRGSQQVPANTVHLDDTFLDTRLALSASWGQPLGKHVDGNVGLAASREYDYTSISVNGGLRYDFNQNNSTLSVGLSFADDTIEPVGNAPLEGTCMVAANARSGCEHLPTQFDQTRGASSESKRIIDLLLGFSQVVNKTTVAEFGYSLSQSSGYHNDPYKVVSVIDTDNSAGNGIGEPERHIYEARPDSRAKHGLFARVKTFVFDKDVIDASYRYVTDDWGLGSHTLEFKYRYQIGNNYLQPRIRYYSQDAVDFYTPFLRDDHCNPG